MTLSQHLNGFSRGDGRKFRERFWKIDRWFEPIFFHAGVWHGLDELGEVCAYQDEREWREVSGKTKKEITLYGPVIAGEHGDYFYMRGDYHSDKYGVQQMSQENIVGWHEIKVQVEV
jgi:hypothetical protein